MERKNLAKAALLAMVLTAGAVSADATKNPTDFETSTLLAVAGCQSSAPQGGGYGGDYSQYEYYTADDAHSPYSTPSRRTNSASSGYEAERQGGGFNNYRSNDRSMTGGGTYPNPDSTDVRPNKGGGGYGAQRNSNPAMNANNDPYMQTNR